MKIFVSDVSGLKMEVEVEPACSHNAFRLILVEKFGRCVPMTRPMMASLVRNEELVREACFRIGQVGDDNTLEGLGELLLNLNAGWVISVCCVSSLR